MWGAPESMIQGESGAITILTIMHRLSAARVRVVTLPRRLLAARCPSTGSLFPTCTSSRLHAFRLLSSLSNDFHATADSILIALEGVLCAALEDAVAELDCVQSMGVLTIALGARGTIVINKQAPNQQLWWSSPLSGPLRFCLDVPSRRWLCTRNDEELLGLLQRELKTLTGVDVELVGAIH